MVSGEILYNLLLVSMLVLAAVTSIVLGLISAPYGRHSRRGWGPAIDNRLGWILMETPAVLVFALCFVLGEYNDGVTAWVFLLMWAFHYAYRAYIYPFRLSRASRRMPVAIIGMGFLFNVMNAYLNGWYLFGLSGGYPIRWLTGPRFLVGLVLFVTGLVINRQADRTLRELRQQGEGGYEIPYGGLYRWISCPNYFGEIVQWLGWAMATWSLAGLAFAVWTMANLIPRALSHHRWYRQHFEYPAERKAVVPGLW